ncbi:glycosyltransferase family 2 protein [Polynucleobacter paneuropaeus]|nr:glycosyltransferase family 2 protein [Polynucleobacter paneuropaeus]
MKNSEIPTVSICIPVFNGENYISQAVVSALAQTYSNYEVIVCDNQSTDNTMNILMNIAKDNPRVRIFQNPTNLGIVGNFNRCLELAKGKYIQFLCADDLLMPTGLDQMVGHLDQHPKLSMVICAREIIDSTGSRRGIKAYSTRDIYIKGVDVINRCFFGANFIGEPSAVLFRRSLARRSFRAELNHLMDQEMWFYLLEQGDMYSLANPLCAIRCHDEQMTEQNINSGDLIRDNVLIYKEYAHRSYMNKNPLQAIKRKLYFCNRVYLCRNALTLDERNFLLKKYASPLMYGALSLYLATLHPLILQARSAWCKST